MTTELKRSKYHLLGLVGQGQFGKVFCAVHRKTGRQFALKSLDHQRFPTHKFLRELRFLLSLQHENIVTCYALEHTRTGRYLVLDYCEGGTLRGLMESEQSLTFHQSLKLILDVLAGLGHAHSRGIVHCDIKPENIMLTLRPGGWAAKISDFGIARLSQELNEQAGNTGSPAYMAPERFYGQYSHASDLYAVGVMLFELLIGDRPFSGSPIELMSAHMNQTLKIPEDLPKALQVILTTSLQKLPARRFRSADEMGTAIKTALTDPAVMAILQNKPIYHFEDEVKVPLPLSLFQSCQTHPLKQSAQTIKTLKLGPSIHNGASGKTLVCQLMGTEFASHLTRFHLNEALQGVPSLEGIELPEPIQQIFLDDQDCFAIGRRAIYLIPNQTSEQVQPQLLTQFPEDSIATIHPQGRWAATVCPTATEPLGVVTLWQIKLQGKKESVWLKPIRTADCRCLTPSSKVLTLDSCHGAIVSEAPAEPNRKPGTLIEVFTRRGQIIGRWKLPVLLKQVVNSLAPYRFMALEQNEPNALLLLDLKPYRLNRIPLEIEPVALAALPWGYILTDRWGKIVCLDDEGRMVGHIDRPTYPLDQGEFQVTAVATVSNYGVLLATWDESQQKGFLHTLDLRTLEMDLVF